MEWQSPLLAPEAHLETLNRCKIETMSLKNTIEDSYAVEERSVLF